MSLYMTLPALAGILLLNPTAANFAGAPAFSPGSIAATQQGEKKAKKIKLRLVKSLSHPRAAATVSAGAPGENESIIEVTSSTVTPDILSAAFNALTAVEAKRSANPKTLVVIHIPTELPAQVVSNTRRGSLEKLIRDLRASASGDVAVDMPLSSN